MYFREMKSQENQFHKSLVYLILFFIFLLFFNKYYFIYIVFSIKLKSLLDPINDELNKER